ncbi:hypothetical protein [Avibacterium sp. 21-599]|uniref:hypothetical protein n=1 Tax=Avibacterium sp. 21-599 TaxID=2911528 RepID=UPI0022465AFD|nr:hypothetical protein [Avibacterium sp. 21-599]MCW9716992.1 hypothetical protein [Avibacterium sp. 21-599]
MAKLHNIYTEEELNLILDEISKYIEVDNKTDCCIWKGLTDNTTPYLIINSGYKRIYITIKRFFLMYENPDRNFKYRIKVDSTCGNMMCVNPYHLKIIEESSNYMANKKIENAMPQKMKKVTQKMVEVLRFYKNNRYLYDTDGEIAIKLEISNSTLSKYLKIYRENPEPWDILINEYNEKNDE